MWGVSHCVGLQLFAANMFGAGLEGRSVEMGAFCAICGTDKF